VASVLLGSPNPWDNSELAAFRSGFNVSFGPRKNLFQVCISRTRFSILLFISRLQTFRFRTGPDYCRKLFAALSNRRVTNSSQVIERLKFQTTDPDGSIRDMLLRQSFQLRLVRWLRGVGHLPGLRGSHLTEDVFEAEKADPLIRGKLFLKAVTDSDLLSVFDDIKVSHLLLNISKF
jgi:hypothetical protein